MGDPTRPKLTVSIVSHGQGHLVALLLEDLTHCAHVTEIIVTQNIPEPDIATPPALQSRIRLIRNAWPLGFGANHNQAFTHCRTDHFTVLNPDLRLEVDPFPALLETLAEQRAGLVAPAVRSPRGTVEDSARHFPTFTQLLAKALRLGDGRVRRDGLQPIAVDWVAGMFMLFNADAFRQTGGFDEGFFLYYEDADICVRLWKNRHKVVLHPGVHVIHAAQRASRRKPRYMMWHVSSMVRYFAKHLWRLPRGHDA